MKKLIGLAVLVALLSFVACADASVGVKQEGDYQGAARDIDVYGNSTFNGNTLTIIANGHKDGVTANVSTESTLTSAALAYGFIRKVAADGTTAQNTVGLADGAKGQMVTIQLVTKGTKSFIIDKTCAATHTTTTGWTTLTFDTSLDSITLLYIDDVYGWIVIGNNGVTVA